MGPIRLLGLVGLGLLGGCSGEQAVEPEPERQQVTVEMQPYMSGYEDVPRSRAWLPPTTPVVYTLVNETEDDKIGICFTQNGQAPKIGQFFKSSEKWRSNVEIGSADTYYLYGYAPHTTGMSCEISSSDTPGDNSAYSEGAVLTIKNISAVTVNDVCVLVGAKNGKDDYKEEPLDFTVTGLQPGQFAYAAETTDPSGDGHNFAFLLFDHLFSALRLRFNVNTKYAALRTIKLKELRLQTYTDPTDESSVNTQKYNVTVKLNKTLDGSSPIREITYTPTGRTDVEGTPFFTSEDGEELPDESTAPKEIVAHFMPAGIKKILLTSTYDVYDRKGNLVRENSEAINAISLGMFSAQTETFRGSRYTITLTVNPTYLYVLSEDELDSPTLVVN